MPSCDECEQFAEEIRIFLNSIPGWHAGGGPLIFAQTPGQMHGLLMVSKEEDQTVKIPVQKLRKAFDDGGAPLTYINEETQPGTFVILVARPET
jgi:hypothetical protein